MFLRSKDETCEVFMIFIRMIQAKLNYKLAGIRLDHGIKFENAKIYIFCAKNGIHNNFSALRTPQQNGVVDRNNRILVDTARTMLVDSGLPNFFWAEAINTMCYVTNRCLIRSILNKTPYELLNKRNPKISYLRPFECKCFLNDGEMNVHENVEVFAKGPSPTNDQDQDRMGEFEAAGDNLNDEPEGENQLLRKSTLKH